MTNLTTRTGLAAAFAVALTLSCASAGAQVQQPSQPLSARGELLYNAHCITCHTTQMHWRDNRQAKDWTGLAFQVRRWQAAAGLGWSDADIVEVSRYLNNTIYKYPQTGDVISLENLRREGGKPAGLVANMRQP